MSGGMASMEQIPPTVLIVGAGLGGIMLGALLEKAGIPYAIFECAPRSAISIGGNLLPAFEQLSILDEYVAMGRHLSHAHFVKEPSFKVPSFKVPSFKVPSFKTRSSSIPFGTGSMILGDMYDRIPKELISKVMLEEKIFTMWSSGRTVLLGDACQKLHPARGQDEDIQKSFTEYQTERLSPVIEANQSSFALASLLEKRLGGTIALWISRQLPQWLWKFFWGQYLTNRPQIGFLPQIENKGSVMPKSRPVPRRPEQFIRSAKVRKQFEE
ncbi:hypothetical protein BGX29_004403 [Mortierella sp. GBA35]|nr:hypothetical protein BGX29_004403 [Mortierella sp. GBA35]